MLWPDPLRVFYFHERNNIMVSAAVLSAIALFLVTAACWHIREKRPYCLFGWLWFLGTLVPVIGIVQVGDQAMAERYTYVPYIGPFIAIVWLVGDAVAKSPKIRMATQALAVAVIAACALKTEAQVKVWKDMETLFSHALEIDPRGSSPNTGLGVAYAREGRIAEAQIYLERALDYSPNSYEAHNNLGTNLSKQGLTQEALKEFRLSLAIKPDQAVAHSKIGRILADTHQLPEAVEEFTQALRFDPGNAWAHNDLGVVLFQLGDYEKAAEQFSDAVRIDPAYTDARRNLDLAQVPMKTEKVENGRK
jgi:tetratricopeptide (TPR) repeat protein